jgi:DNA-binding transcriptional LysR family regulator
MNAMHVDNLYLTQIRLLAELSRSLSLSRAAQQLGLSQSAASHALARMREHLGNALFTRTRDGFQPTPFGARLGRASCEALDVLLSGLNSKEEFNPATASRVFTFLTNDVGQVLLLPQLVKFVKQKAPAATIRVLQIPLHDRGAALSSGEVDFAVGLFDNLTAGFLQTRVVRERSVCIVRRNHPLFRDGMSVDAFKAVEHAVADAPGMTHAVLENRFLARQRIRRKVRLRVPGLLVLPMIVADSDLLAVVPKRLAEAFASRLPIKVMLPPVSIPSYVIRLHWHERYDQDPAIQWMRRTFIDLFRQRR